MGKWKGPLLLLLTLALVAAGALLPRLVAAVTDGSAAERVDYGELTPVELDLREKTSLTTEQKLFLVHHGDSIQISAADVSMTEAEALAAAENALTPYYDAGLLPTLAAGETTCSPVLTYSTINDFYGYFWQITILQDGNWQLELVLDDETGRLMSIFFWTGDHVFYEEKMDATLETFVDICLGALELERPEDSQYTGLDGERRSVRCWWLIPDNSGELNFSVEFMLCPNGFDIVG